MLSTHGGRDCRPKGSNAPVIRDTDRRQKRVRTPFSARCYLLYESDGRDRQRLQALKSPSPQRARTHAHYRPNESNGPLELGRRRQAQKQGAQLGSAVPSTRGGRGYQPHGPRQKVPAPWWRSAIYWTLGGRCYRPNGLNGPLEDGSLSLVLSRALSTSARDASHPRSTRTDTVSPSCRSSIAQSRSSTWRTGEPST